jgi:hypothetical protein
LPLFTGGTFIESFFRQDRGEVIDMQAVAHASACMLRQRCYIPVAIIVSRHRIMENAQMGNLPAFGAELNDRVAVLGFSSVSVVHDILFSFLKK